MAYQTGRDAADMSCSMPLGRRDAEYASLFFTMAGRHAIITVPVETSMSGRSILVSLPEFSIRRREFLDFTLASSYYIAKHTGPN